MFDIPQNTSNMHAEFHFGPDLDRVNAPHLDTFSFESSVFAMSSYLDCYLNACFFVCVCVCRKASFSCLFNSFRMCQSPIDLMAPFEVSERNYFRYGNCWVKGFFYSPRML